METAGTGNTFESVVHLDCQYGTIWRGEEERMQATVQDALFRGGPAQLSMEQGLLYVLIKHHKNRWIIMVGGSLRAHFLSHLGHKSFRVERGSLGA